MIDDDATLLRRYAREGSQEAFAELVRRHLDLVYAAAWRRMGGDAHRAAEVAQLVFTSLARHAARLVHHAVLAAWLHATTRNVALNLRREETRRHRREQEAYAMQKLTETAEPAIDWDRLRPVLDAAVDELEARDREAVVVRFFQGRSFSEVGAALRVSEEAARKRVDRALDKLRAQLARRGIASTSGALGLALAQQSMMAAPASLAASVLATSTTGGGALASLVFDLMSIGKMKMAAAAGIVALTLGIGLGLQQRAEAKLTSVTAGTAEQAQALANLRRETAAMAEANRALAAEPPPPAPIASAIPASDTILARLRLLMDLKRRGVHIYNPSFINPRTGQAGPDFVALFGLAAGEVETIQATWRDARRQLAELAAARAVTRRTDTGEFTIEMKGFEGGGPVYDRLMDTVAAVLGAERKTAFHALMETSTAISLYHFGAEQRTLKLTRAPATSDGAPAYLLDEDWMVPDDPAARVPDIVRPGVWRRPGPVGESSRGIRQTRAELEQTYGAIARLVPSDL